jgi:dedicator of cytokinesis protein 6/7/8
MLTITLSELMSDVQVTQMKSDGSLEESGEVRRLRKSLEEMADVRSQDLLKECSLPVTALEAAPEGSTDNRWSWVEVKHLSKCLVQALDAGLEHAFLVSKFCQ